MSEHSAQRSRRRAVHGVAAVAGVAIAVAVVAGCASKGGGLAARSDKSVGGAIQYAAAQVVAAKSVHIHGAVSGAASGTVDGSVVFAPTLQGDLTFKIDQADADTTRILYDGKTFYTSIPKVYHATSQAKPNATWFAVSPDTLGPKVSPVLATLKSDPAALVKQVLAKGDFVESGSGTVDGVAATHFTSDLVGVGDVGHVDIWLDGSGLPVEIVAQSTADKQPPGHTELHFSQWGKPVTITPPPAGQVLTEQDQISFAISGQQFKISGDKVTGTGLPSGGLVLGTAPSRGAGQQICVPVNAISSPSQPSQPSEPEQPAPTTICVTVTMPAAPTHT